MQRPVDLNVDVTNLAIVTDAGGTRSDKPVFLRGETALLRVHFVTVDADAEDAANILANFAIESGTALYFAAKPTADYAADPALADSGPDEWNVAGDWADTAIANGKCSCRVNWNTAAVNTLLGDTLASVEVICQIEAVDPNSRPIALCQFAATLLNDVRRGLEGAPPALGAGMQKHTNADGVEGWKLMTPDGTEVISYHMPAGVDP